MTTANSQLKSKPFNVVVVATTFLPESKERNVYKIDQVNILLTLSLSLLLLLMLLMLLLRCEKHEKLIHMAGDENESRFSVKGNMSVKVVRKCTC